MRRPVIVCVGNGLAALQLALHINEDFDLMVFSSSTITNTNSCLAKGGIAIPIHEKDVQKHIEDTLIAGAGLCNQHAVEYIIGHAAEVYNDLHQQGIQFDASISQEGGHSRPRIRHISDETGRYLIHGLKERALKKSNVHFYENCQLIDLIMEDGVCKGIWYADLPKKRLKSFHADAVVLASGGGANLYKHHTNSFYANAEAIAIAYRAGVEIAGMEFVQFHPTRLYEKNTLHHLLITEALRGAGAVIRNHKDEEIMQGVHDLKSLAPRDIVSRTMFKEMQKHQLEYLKLDLTEVNKKQMEKDFPLLDTTCMLEGFYFNGYIPVTPAAHYFCGGIQTGLYAETNIEGLYALGEAASTGLHGANRLASNSLLELLVIGKSLATHLNNHLEAHGEIYGLAQSIQSDSVYYDINRFIQPLKNTMWKHFGIVRSHASMMDGLLILIDKKKEIDELIKENGVQITLLQVANFYQSAIIIAESALQRKESRGCHYREDYPQVQNQKSSIQSFQSHFPELFESIHLEEPDLIEMFN